MLMLPVLADCRLKMLAYTFSCALHVSNNSMATSINIAILKVLIVFCIPCYFYQQVIPWAGIHLF
jgi:hypothetical protein